MRQDTDMLICEDFFDNKKDVLLSVRVPKDLCQTLESLAIENDQPFADFVRSCLCFHALPSMLKEMASEGPLDEENKNLLQEVQEYCQSILGMCEGVQTIKRHALGLRKLSKELEALIESKVREKFDKTILEMRNDLERHEAERAHKKKMRKLAGLEQPGDPLQLTESEKSGLSPKQRKERRSLGWDRD